MAPENRQNKLRPVIQILVKKRIIFWQHLRFTILGRIFGDF